jgi:hypothetical protein
MNLKSFGCSFIFGTDLADDGRDQNYATPSRLTWPALLAQKLNYGYQCYARPGAGNLRTAERTLSQLACNDPALYIIGWTWVDRFDYTQDDDKWLTLMPGDITAHADYYYRNLHSQYRDKLSTLMSIKLVIDTLRQKGYPYIMTYMDDLIFETKWHTTPAITDLQEYIRPHMTTFDNMNFLDWSRENGHLISKTKHPLESAHASAAEYMLNVFDKQKINALTQWVLLDAEIKVI